MSVPNQPGTIFSKGFRVGKRFLCFILLFYLSQTSLTAYLVYNQNTELEKLREKLKEQQFKLQAQGHYVRHLEKYDFIQAMLRAKDSRLEELQQKYVQQQSTLSAQTEKLRAKEWQDRLSGLLIEKDQKLEEIQHKYHEQVAVARTLGEKILVERELQDILAEKERQLDELREKYYQQQVALLTQEMSLNNFKEKERVAQILERFKTGLTKSEEDTLRDLILSESRRYGIDPNLILAMIQTESTFNNWAKSKQGAMGLMQILPPTGKSIAEDANVEWKGKDGLYEPDTNLRLGLHYLAQLMLHFQDVKLALAAYNMGPTAVKRLMDKGESVPQEYVERVLENYKALSQNASSVTETNSDGKSDKLKVAREEK